MINKHIFIFIFIFIINLSFLFAQGMSELEDSQNVFDTSKLRNEISSKVRNQFSKIVSQAGIIDQGKCGDNAYWHLTNDGTVTIFGQGITNFYTIGQPWRKYRSQIKNVIVKEGIENLHCSAFYGLERLENISFPNSLKHLYVGQFNGNPYPSLKPLHIPNSVQFIDVCISSKFNIEIDGGLDSVLEGTCGPDAKFKFDKNTGTLRIYGSGNIEPLNYKWHLYKERIKKVYIEDKISNIPQQAFMNCHNLESVDMTNNITSIGFQAFYYCYNLESVDMTNNITSIGFQAFDFCSSLKKISIPQDVKKIYYEAFRACISLSKVTIPKTVVPIEVGENLFAGCSSNLVVKAPKYLKGKMKEEDYIKIEYY